MSFSKETYRKHREKGERGQDPYPGNVVSTDSTPATSLRGLGRRHVSRHQTAKHEKGEDRKYHIGRHATAYIITQRATLLKQRVQAAKPAKQIAREVAYQDRLGKRMERAEGAGAITKA